MRTVSSYRTQAIRRSRHRMPSWELSSFNTTSAPPGRRVSQIIDRIRRSARSRDVRRRKAGSRMHTSSGLENCNADPRKRGTHDGRSSAQNVRKRVAVEKSAFGWGRPPYYPAVVQYACIRGRSHGGDRGFGSNRLRDKCLHDELVRPSNANCTIDGCIQGDANCVTANHGCGHATDVCQAPDACATNTCISNCGGTDKCTNPDGCATVNNCGEEDSCYLETCQTLNACNTNQCKQTNTCVASNVCSFDACGVDTNTCTTGTDSCATNECVNNTCAYNACSTSNYCVANSCNVNSCTAADACTSDDSCGINTCNPDTDCGFTDVSCAPKLNKCGTD